jgi:hypothetical protein
MDSETTHSSGLKSPTRLSVRVDAFVIRLKHVEYEHAQLRGISGHLRLCNIAFSSHSTHGVLFLVLLRLIRFIDSLIYVVSR